MDMGSSLGFYSAIAALVVVTVVPIYRWRRSGPKKRVEYALHVAALINETTAHLTDFRITSEDQIISRPYICEINLWSSGRTNITPEDFEDGCSMLFDLGKNVRVVGIVSQDGDFELQVGEKSNLITYPPNFILSGYTPRQIIVICSGKPTPRLLVPHPLANTVISDPRHKKPTPKPAKKPMSAAWLSNPMWGGIGGLLGIAGIIASVVFYLIGSRSS